MKHALLFSVSVALVTSLTMPNPSSKQYDLSPEQGSGLVQLNSEENLETYTFQQFMTQFRREYKEGTQEFIKRERVFYKNLKFLIGVNKNPRSLWRAGVNKFMDMSQDEFEKMLGYKKASKGMVSSFLQNATDSSELPVVTLPKKHDWRDRMSRSASFHQDQGACGSCWATAAVSALESHLEVKYGKTSALSSQFLVSCVPNPKKCGGTGGCQGATSEMALEYIAKYGIPSAKTWPYTSLGGDSGKCDERRHKMSHAAVESFRVLPENKGAPLLQALYQVGPVVVSVDASTWNLYKSGVFSACDKDAIINHAVVAVGFGEQLGQFDEVHKYYLLKNSWGSDWGEHGHIRLQRFDDDDAHCGVDDKPMEGTACEGGPSQVRVCGMCGILYDSTYPVGARFANLEESNKAVGEKKPADGKPMIAKATSALQEGLKLIMPVW
jgi:cathepsin L